MQGTLGSLFFFLAIAISPFTHAGNKTTSAPVACVFQGVFDEDKKAWVSGEFIPAPQGTFLGRPGAVVPAMQRCYVPLDGKCDPEDYVTRYVLHGDRGYFTQLSSPRGEACDGHKFKDAGEARRMAGLMNSSGGSYRVLPVCVIR